MEEFDSEVAEESKVENKPTSKDLTQRKFPDSRLYDVGKSQVHSSNRQTDLEEEIASLQSRKE